MIKTGFGASKQLLVTIVTCCSGAQGTPGWTWVVKYSFAHKNKVCLLFSEQILKNIETVSWAQKTSVCILKMLYWYMTYFN